MSPTKQIAYIRPTKSFGESFRELVAYRELVLFLMWRDLLVRYKQTAVGVAWLVLRPLVLAAILYGVFGGNERIAAGETSRYPALLICGLVPWFYFSAAVGEAANALIGDANLVSKVYFPRMCLPFASILGNLLDLTVLAILSFGVAFACGIDIPLRALLVVPIFAIAVLAASGAGLLLGILSARYRDFRYVTGFLLQFGLFASPVIYVASSVVPSHLLMLYFVNPMAGVIEGIRWAVLGMPLDGTAFVVSLVCAVLLFVMGMSVFMRMERSIADVV